MTSKRDQLLNASLGVVVTDPWELASLASAQTRAVVAAVDGDVDRGGLVLAVDEPYEYRGVTYRLLVALARGPESLADALVREGTAEANLYGIVGNALPADPFALEWWRGGLGAIATLGR